MLGAVDLTDLDMWARAVPYEEFGRLRREAPVAWSPDEGSGFWSFYKVSSPTIYAPWIALAVLVIGFELSDLTKAPRDRQ